MPKSKNRRKQKSSKASNPSSQTASLDAEVVDAAPGGKDHKAERGDSQPAKKKSVGPVQFFRQVRAEMQKITWTSRGETMISTIMVLIMVAIMSVFFFSVDQLLRFVVPRILALNFF